jgi:hypothetical protein
VAEQDGHILGSNFLDARSLIGGIGPITIDPAVQNKRILVDGWQWSLFRLGVRERGGSPPLIVPVLRQFTDNEVKKGGWIPHHSASELGGGSLCNYACHHLYSTHTTRQ